MAEGVGILPLPEFLCDPRHWQLEIEFPYSKNGDTKPILCSVLVLEIIMEKDILHSQRLYMSVSRRVTGPVSVSSVSVHQSDP